MRNRILSCLSGVVFFAASAHADHFGDIDYRVPAGWQKVEKGGFAILASPLDARGKPRAAIFVAPGSGYSGDFAQWFASTVREGESGETSISRSAVQRLQARGAYEALRIDSVTEDRQGTTTHRSYVAANPGGRAELFVYMTYSDRDAQQYLPSLRTFLESVQYRQLDSGRRRANAGAVASSTGPSPAQGRATSGGRCRTVTRQQCMSGMSGGFGGTMTPTYNCLPVTKTVCN